MYIYFNNKKNSNKKEPVCSTENVSLQWENIAPIPFPSMQNTNQK